MPTSKIEKELLKATKLDADDYKKRQDLFVAILEEVNAFKDPQWDKLSEPAQLWINASIKAKKAEKRLPEFPDVGDVKPDADEDEDEAPKKKKPAADEDDEDEAPKKKKKPAADDDDEEDEAPKKKKKPAADDDEEEDEAPKKKKKAEADEDEDEAPKKKKRPAEDEEEDEAPKKKKKPAAEDEEEDEAPKKKKKPAADEDEDEAPKKKKAAAVPQKASGVKVAIKDAIIADTDISVDAIVKLLGKGGADVSKVTVSNVRAEFRHTLKLLKERGKLKGIEL
jgi:hypothetical protein